MKYLDLNHDLQLRREEYLIENCIHHFLLKISPEVQMFLNIYLYIIIDLGNNNKLNCQHYLSCLRVGSIRKDKNNVYFLFNILFTRLSEYVQCTSTFIIMSFIFYGKIICLRQQEINIDLLFLFTSDKFRKIKAIFFFGLSSYNNRIGNSMMKTIRL